MVRTRLLQVSMVLALLGSTALPLVAHAQYATTAEQPTVIAPNIPDIPDEAPTANTDTSSAPTPPASAPVTPPVAPAVTNTAPATTPAPTAPATTSAPKSALDDLMTPTAKPSLEDMMAPAGERTPPPVFSGRTPPPVMAAPAPAKKELEPGSYVLKSVNGPPLVFVPATPENLSKSFIKFSGADLNDDALLDDFASVNQCELFIQHSEDEFAWRDARKAIRRHIERNMENYPEYIAFDSKVQFDKYDFGIQAFRLADGSKFSRTGRFTISTRLEGSCTRRGGLTRIPEKYTIRLSNPITLDAIPMKEERAYRLLNDMKETRNKDRVTYITFFIRINDFSASSNPASGRAADVVQNADARATLVSLRFYEDQERTRLLYEYQPETTNPFDQ